MQKCYKNGNAAAAPEFMLKAVGICAAAAAVCDVCCDYLSARLDRPVHTWNDAMNVIFLWL